MTLLRTDRLLAFARELQRAATFEELFVSVRSELVASVGYAHVWLAIAEKDDPTTLRLIDYAGAMRGAVWDVAPILRVEGDRMLEEVVRSEAPVVVIDARTDPRTDKQIVARLGNRTIVNIPLRLLDRPLGAMGTGTFGDEEGCRPPTAEQLDYLVAMGSELSAAAGRIRLLEERRRSEQALKKSEADLRITLDSIGDGVIATDSEGRVTRMNPVAEKLTGWRAEEAEGCHLPEVFRLLHESTRLPAEGPLERVLREGECVQFPGHTILVSREGRELFITDSGAPIRDEDGAMRGVVVVFRDQTEERRAARALRESEARKAAVMEAALDSIVMMDEEGFVTEFNPAAERMFGYSRAEALGRSLGELLVPPLYRNGHVRGLQRYLQTGEAHVLGKRVELSAQRRDGSQFPAEVAVVRIRSEGPAVFTGYIRDITDRRQAAEAEMLRRAKEAAEEANAELEAFSYSVAHDLRAPLRAINGFSRLLAEDYGAQLDAAALDHLDNIAAGAGKMAELIDALLGLARLARTELAREPVDLTLVAHDVARALRAGEPGRVATVDIAEGLAARGDPGLLRVLLENLLGNAWKFTSKRSEARIELGCEQVADFCTFYVRDNGAGFDMTRTEKLFAPFGRLHVSADFEGHGIGLATVQRIIRRHGGRVWAQAVENQGATFHFTLPSVTHTSLAPRPTV